MRVLVGDITKVQNIDAIVNASNALGIMGSGVAGAIARSGGDLLKQNVKKVIDEKGPFQLGDIFVSDSGRLKRRGIKHVYHAVTMEFAGGGTSVGTIGPLLTRVLEKALSEGLESIAFGGLGCGIGGLTKEEVAKRMAHISQEYNGRIKITVIDTSEDFIKAFLDNLSIEVETINEEETINKPSDSSPE